MYTVELLKNVSGQCGFGFNAFLILLYLFYGFLTCVNMNHFKGTVARDFEYFCDSPP